MKTRVISRRFIRVIAPLGLLLALSATASTASAAQATSLPVLHGLSARTTVVGGASVLATTRTVPHWHGSFVDGVNGQTYGYNMVGADPSTSTATNIRTEIIPLQFTFNAFPGVVPSGDVSQMASWVAESPIFTAQSFPSEPTESLQFEDAVMRSEFDQVGSSNYHVSLSNTAVLPTVTIAVPSKQGTLGVAPDGTIAGVVSDKWFASQFHSIISSLNLDPSTLPIVVDNNVFLYSGTTADCCVIGFHGAANITGTGAGSTNGNGDQPVQTFVFASWVSSPQIFGPSFTDISTLTHEVSEWAQDPFANNEVNSWYFPSSGYPCSNLLEVADPLTGVAVAFPATPANPETLSGPEWHIQDIANLWWFARQQSQASNSEYSYFGTLTSPAPTCPS